MKRPHPKALHLLTARFGSIEVIAGVACGQCKMGRIDIVRANFEGLEWLLLTA
jgi:hypothetical protein